jgi:hypothetical protein
LEQAFLKDIIERLETAKVVYAITGSIASNYWGIPRTTHDVDIVIVLQPEQISPLVSALSADVYYLSEQAVKEAVSSGNMFNLIDTSTGLKADFWVFKGDPFNQSMLSRRHREELVQGTQAYVGSPEDVLLHKLVWYKITPSDRQLSDAAGIAAVQKGNLDLDYMRAWAARQSTGDLLEDVLQGKYLKQT